MAQGGVRVILPVQSNRLDVPVLVREAFCSDGKVFSVFQMEGGFFQHRGMYQIIVLSGIGIKSCHVEGKPRRHRSRIIVSGEPHRRVVKVGGDDFADAVIAPPGFPYPVIQAGGKKRRLVVHIIKVFVEEDVEAFFEFLLPSALCDKPRHIVRDHGVYHGPSKVTGV